MIMNNENSLMLHPERGINPRMMVCECCGKDAGIVLLGIHEKVYKCVDCGQLHIGKPPLGCQRCKSNVKYDRVLNEYERIPNGLCDDCKNKKNECDEVVKEGGVYWRCKKCGSTGAIKKENELSKIVREKLGVETPKPCGVELDECPACDNR